MAKLGAPLVGLFLVVQRATLIGVALLFGARCEYERLLVVARGELGADRDELVDLMTQWSRR